MQLTRWILGGTVLDDEPDQIPLRALTLNIDDLTEFNDKLNKLFDQVTITSYSEQGGEGVVCGSIDDLLLLSKYDRNQIVFQCAKTEPGTNNQGFGHFQFFAFRSGRATFDGHSYLSEPYVKEAVATLKSGARQRFASYTKLRFIISTFFLVYLALFVYTCWAFASARAVPLLVLAGLAAIGSWPGIRGIIELLLYTRLWGKDGLRINQYSRTKLDEDRANRWANAKVGIPSLILGAFLTALVRYYVK